REISLRIEPHSVLHTAADEIEQVNRVALGIVTRTHLVEVAVLPELLAFPDFVVSTRGALRVGQNGPPQISDGLKRLSNHVPLCDALIGRPDGHGGRTREGFVPSSDLFRDVRSDERSEVPLAALVRDRMW